MKANEKYAAFYPFKEKDYKTDIKHITIDYTGQTQGNWMKYDFIATGAVQPKDGAVTFTMKRLSAILKIQFTLSSSSITHIRYATLIAEEPLFGVKGTLDLSGSEPIYTPEGLTKFINTDLGVDKAASSTESTVFTFYLMIPPTNLRGKQVKLLFNSDSGTAKEAFINGQNYEAGKAYSINLDEPSDAMIRNSNLIVAAGLGDGTSAINAWAYREKILQVKSIVVSGKDDPTVCDEIGFFRNLEELKCSRNGITYLDVSNNPKLTYLGCYYNELTSLDVSNNTALTELDCDNNQLTSLDVSNNTALYDLRCDGNQLTSFVVTNHSSLSKLNIANNPKLTSLDCSRNALTTLDFTGCTALKSLDCNKNRMTKLDISSFFPTLTRYNVFCGNQKDADGENQVMTLTHHAQDNTTFRETSLRNWNVTLVPKE